MTKQPKRGEIWLLDWSPARGSEQAGLRPALVIQTDAANTNPRYPNTIVLAVSTKGKLVPFHLEVQPSKKNGLTERSYIKSEQILTVSKDRLNRKLGTLEDDLLKLASTAVLLVLALES
jgi:mRNA interferase MazF